MPQPTHKFLIRIRMDLFQLIRESSTINHRSMNAEINFRLAHSLSQGIELEGSDFLPADDAPAPTQVQARLTELIPRLSPARQAALLALLTAD